MSAEVIDCMVGVTMDSVVATRGEEVDDTLVFTGGGFTFTFYHSQDCCEIVTIEDIVGDLEDLVGSPILMAESVDNDGGDNAGLPEEVKDGPPDDRQEWTFYKFATAKGFVTVRWFGSSNGYYSTVVSFEKRPVKS